MDKLLAAFIKPGKLAPGQSSAEFVKHSIPKSGYADWFQMLLDAQIAQLIESGLVVDAGNCYKLTSAGKNRVRDMIW